MKFDKLIESVLLESIDLKKFSELVKKYGMEEEDNSFMGDQAYYELRDDRKFIYTGVNEKGKIYIASEDLYDAHYRGVLSQKHATFDNLKDFENYLKKNKKAFTLK